MFGFGKKKTLDIELMYKQVANSVVNVFVNDKALDFQKFIRISPFSYAAARGGDQMVERFFREKLVLLCAFSVIVIDKTVGGDDIVARLLEATEQVVREQKVDQIDYHFDKMPLDVQNCITSRISLSAKEAGKMLEQNFARNVFGVLVDEGDIDANYLLYTSLVNIERSMIFNASAAIKRSRV